jgi:hypothetical protein
MDEVFESTIKTALELLTAPAALDTITAQVAACPAFAPAALRVAWLAPAQLPPSHCHS